MLSISGINNAGYYENLAKEDYYEKGGEPSGQWQGKGAESLGLEGSLKNDELKKMLEGYDPKTDEALASNAGDDHRRGHDLCFSAPKSVSTAWASGNAELREQIQQAQAKAVSKTVEYIEENVANVRRSRGGTEHEKANIIAASYEHSTSRTQDPQLHTHMLVASHAIGQKTGDVRSLDSRTFFQNQKSMGAVYRAELASEMQKLGFKIERDSQSFKIAGSNKNLEKEWSKRREEVVQQLKKNDTSGAKASEAAALSSRATKQNIDRKELFQKWQGEAKEHRFDVKSIQNNDELKYDKPKFNIDKILESATEQQAVFNKAQLHALVAQELQGVDSADAMQKKLQELEKSGELVNLGQHDHQQQYTTKNMLKLEQNIVDFAKNGQGKEDWRVSDSAIEKAIENKKGISLEQQQALRHITKSGQVTCVTGAAGTGKSFMLAAAKESFERENYKVTGCSLGGKAAAELQNGSGIKSQTIHSLLNELDNEQRTLNSKDIIVMDEAGTTDTKLMSRLVDKVKDSNAKLILVGDTAQLQSVTAGGSFGKVSKEIGSSEILEVRRQKVEWQKQAANDFRSGKSASALAAYKKNNSLHIDKTTKQTHSKMIEKWAKSDTKISEKMMIAGRRKDVASLNKIARSELKKSDELGAEVTAIVTDKDQNESKIKIAENERLRFTKNDKKLGIMNGDLCTVKDINIDQNGNTILDVQLDRDSESDKSIKINMSQYSNVQHGYAITAHASQGATVDESFFYASSFNSKEMSYVSSSRQRFKNEIFASEEEIGSEVEQQLEKLMSKTDEKFTALDKLETSTEQKTDNNIQQTQDSDNQNDNADKKIIAQKDEDSSKNRNGAQAAAAAAAKTKNIGDKAQSSMSKANSESASAFDKSHQNAISADEQAAAKHEMKQQISM